MASSDYSAIAEMVPQVSYEIVGRIIPGIIVILSLVVASMGPAHVVQYLDKTIAHPDHALSGWAVVLILFVAYILSFTLDGLWQIPAYFRRCSAKPSLRDFQAPSHSMKFAAVNLEFPKAGAWLTKLYAETNATQVLIIGWVISAAINVYCLVAVFSAERLWLEVGLVAGMTGAAAVRNSIAATRDDSLENLWLLLQERTLVEQAEKAGWGCEGER